MADRVVIMSNGEIDQVGTPKEIYRAPATRFVAEFVGRNNILTGTVAASANGTSDITTPSGSFKVNADLTVGDDATFVVSADLVQVSPEKPDAENTVQCRLLSEEFVGSMVTMFLESSDGHEFKVQMQERALSEFDLKGGDEVWLDWSAAHAHILDTA